MSDTSERKVYRTFLLSISLVVTVCILGIFLGMALRSHGLIRQEMLERARAHFRNIVLTRQWNADHGGVYVEKKPGMQSNPYLKNPDITATDGRVFTKKNPALMTREISVYAREKGLFTFHITSLKLLNPANQPDPFETAALQAFERGTTEITAEEAQPGGSVFRYMGPLRVEPACLACHAGQGYRVGDVRGGISVTFDIADVRRTMRCNLLVIALLGALITALLLLLIYRFFRRLKRSLEQARLQLRHMAATDMLTGIANRRTLMERFHAEFHKARRHGRPLGCMLIDIDDFKSINDTLGHEQGDDVLRRFCERVRPMVRAYDVFGRYGGEEFMIVCPETDGTRTAGLAERICRMAAADLRAPAVAAGDGPQRPITVSVGVTELRADDADIDAVGRRADRALYEAKRGGRNRVCSA